MTYFNKPVRVYVAVDDVVEAMLLMLLLTEMGPTRLLSCFRDGLEEVESNGEEIEDVENVFERFHFQMEE